MLIMGFILAYSFQYVENVSFFQDFRIIIKTIKKVFVKEGINAHNSATIDYFRGTGDK